MNGRFLDIKIRGFDIDPGNEKKIPRLDFGQTYPRNNSCESGNWKGGEKTQSLSFNKERFEAIEAILLEIQKEYGRHLDMGNIVNANDLFTYMDAESMGSNELIRAVDLACSEVSKMRLSEGEKLKNDFEERLTKLKNELGDVEMNLPDEFQKREEKYRSRIAELLNGPQIDKSRIAQEIAMLAEKADVTEEVVRLKSHIQQFQSLLEADEPTGRRLNFLLQEMGREINTIGSKNSSEKIVNYVITMKDETEKMREQVQNIL